MLEPLDYSQCLYPGDRKHIQRIAQDLERLCLAAAADKLFGTIGLTVTFAGGRPRNVATERRQTRQLPDTV